MTAARNWRPDEIYDQDHALALCAGLPEIREQVVSGIVGLFAIGGDLSDLLDVDHYAANPAHIRNLAHRAAGLAGQGAMLALLTVCKSIESALDNGDINSAQDMGRQIGPLIGRISEVAELFKTP